jgi:hypothetical protein
LFCGPDRGRYIVSINAADSTIRQHKSSGDRRLRPKSSSTSTFHGHTQPQVREIVLRALEERSNSMVESQIHGVASFLFSLPNSVTTPTFFFGFAVHSAQMASLASPSARKSAEIPEKRARLGGPFVSLCVRKDEVPKWQWDTKRHNRKIPCTYTTT